MTLPPPRLGAVHGQIVGHKGRDTHDPQSRTCCTARTNAMRVDAAAIDAGDRIIARQKFPVPIQRVDSSILACRDSTYEREWCEA
jgi:hypothetical protein